MRRRLLAFLLSCLAVAPAAAIEPEMREVIVTHNRVWDGYVYKENYVPSDIDEMLLMSDVDNAVDFVRTQEYYWPLSRQSYVAFERQREEVDGRLVIRNSAGVVAEIDRQPFSIHYSEGAVQGDGELLWGDDAERGYSQFREEERAFVRDLTSLKRRHTEYETALREAASARIRGEPIPDVPPPPEAPQPMLKLVTPPQPAFRVELPAGRYEAMLVKDGAEVAGTRRSLKIIDDSGSDVVVLDIVPEERWTRPVQSNRVEDRIYVRPGARFFVTAHDASRYNEADYVRLVAPHGRAPADRETWVRRKPAEAESMLVDWRGADEPDTSPLTNLKVMQTQGASFGYVVREAREGEPSDLAAYPVRAPEGAAIAEGRLDLAAHRGAVVREVVVVQPRNAALVWSLALIPAAMGMALAWRNWSRRRGE